MVCLNSSARVPFVISDRRWPVTQKQVTVPVTDLQVSHQPRINRQRLNLQQHCPFQGCLRLGSPLRCTSPTYIHMFLSFLHCLFCLKYNTKLSFTHTTLTGILRQSSAFTWIDTAFTWIDTEEL